MAFMRSENKNPECHDLESLDIDIDIAMVVRAFLQFVIVFLKLRLSSSSCVFRLT